MLDTYPIVIPGGVVTDASSYARRGRWVDSDKIRFRMGKPEGIGGWVRAIEAPVKGRARHLQAFASLTGARSLFIGTNAKAYVWFSSAQLNDITPIVESGTRTNQIFTTSGSARVGINLLATTPKSLGTYIRISGSSAVGGVPSAEINREHLVVQITGDTFFFDVTTPATSSVAGGGGTVNYEVDYPAGNADTTGSAGWGVPGWGLGGWGGEGLTTAQRLGYWYSDNWGEDILSNPVGGPIFYWDATNPTVKMSPISTFPGAAQVPVAIDRVLVWEQSRIALAFACNAIGQTSQDPLLVRWSDNENYLMWDPAVAGSASGELRLSVGSTFVTAIKAPNEILAWTDVGLHSISPTGGSSVFSLRVLSPRTSIYGPKAAVVMGDVVYWAGPLGFFRYAGSMQMIPCPVEEYMRSRLSPERSAKVVAAANAEFSELFWFYPSTASVNGEPDSYVKYNVVENLWDIGTMDRLAWLDSGTFNKPIAVNFNGTVLFHEIGADDVSDGVQPAPISRFIEHGPIEIDGKGNNFILTRWLLPDFSFTQTAVGSGMITASPRFSYGSGFPKSINATPSIDIPIQDLGGQLEGYRYQVRMRGRGRELSMRFSSSSVGMNWRLGDNRIVGRPDGRR